MTTWVMTHQAYDYEGKTNTAQVQERFIYLFYHLIEHENTWVIALTKHKKAKPTLHKYKNVFWIIIRHLLVPSHKKKKSFTLWQQRSPRENFSPWQTVGCLPRNKKTRRERERKTQKKKKKKRERKGGKKNRRETLKRRGVEPRRSHRTRTLLLHVCVRGHLSSPSKHTSAHKKPRGKQAGLSGGSKSRTRSSVLWKPPPPLRG